MFLCLLRWKDGISHRSNLSILSLAFISLATFSCQPSESERVQELKFRIEQDSVLMAGLNSEMDEINDLLAQADHLNEFLSNQESIDKRAAISKIRAMESLLNISYKKIDSLEAAFKNSSSSLKRNAVVKNTLSRRRDDVAFANDYYQQLELNVKMLTGQNINLAKTLRERDLTIAERDQTIVTLSSERDEQEQQLTDLNAKISAAERSLIESERLAKLQKEETIKERAEFYYMTGVEMRDMFDETGSFGTKKTRRELINKAYEYLKRANDLGHTRARSAISQIETDRKYSKFLD